LRPVNGQIARLIGCCRRARKDEGDRQGDKALALPRSVTINLANLVMLMTLAIGAEPTPLKLNEDSVVLVANTRVTLDTVVAAFLEGATAEEIVEQYPSLQLADVYSVIAYYLRHRTEVDAYLKDRQARAAQVRQENERRFNPIGIRERLMSRLDHQRQG
jgi:uncharacterized protein (DUF433 family)